MITSLIDKTLLFIIRVIYSIAMNSVGSISPQSDSTEISALDSWEAFENHQEALESS